MSGGTHVEPNTAVTVSPANESRPAPAQQGAFALLLLWLAGVCLRVTVLAIPPVIRLLHRDLNLSETDVGWLSSLPPMLFALAAIPRAVLIARLGMVRAWFPRRIGFATAVYTNGLLAGETIAVALTIPLVLPLVDNSWRLSFVIWSIPAFATAVLIIACAPRPQGTNGAAAASRLWWPDWRRPLIWRLGAILGSVNSMYFVTNAFLPDFMTSLGRPDLISSALTAANFCQLPASLIMLAVAGRLVKQPWAYVVAGALSLMSLIGIITAASGAWIVFWSGVLGFVTTAILVLGLALPSVLSAPDDVHRTSAGMFIVSYTIAMVLSVLGGWLWDFTRSPIASFVPVALCAVVVMALASTANHPEHPENAS